jgi:hypothetical protein
MPATTRPARQRKAIPKPLALLTLILLAGVWLVASETLGHAESRTIVAGVLRALGGLLLIIATRYGGFGHRG